MKYAKIMIGIAILVLLDQVSKYLVIHFLDIYTYYPVLGDLFGLFYLENEGMAWGLFQNKQMIFLIITVIVLIILGYICIKLIKEQRFQGLLICLQFLIAGAVGNMIDRIFHGTELFQGAVIDFLYIKCINFPVFNLADMYVTGSVACMVLLILFRYKEQDFQEVLFSKKKNSITEQKNEEDE